MEPLAQIGVSDSVVLSFVEVERGVIAFEEHQRFVPMLNRSSNLVNCVTVIIPLNNRADTPKFGRLSNEYDTDQEGSPLGTGRAVLIEFPTIPAVFSSKEGNSDKLCYQMDKTMTPSERRINLLNTITTREAGKKKIVAYIFPGEMTCNNEYFNINVSIADKHRVVLNYGALACSQPDSTPDQLASFLSFEVAVDGTAQLSAGSDLHSSMPGDYYSNLVGGGARGAGKNIYFLYCVTFTAV